MYGPVYLKSKANLITCSKILRLYIQFSFDVFFKRFKNLILLQAPWTIFKSGIVGQTRQLIRIFAERIMFRVVKTKTMPQGNKTGITEAEREMIGRWITQGARVN